MADESFQERTEQATPKKREETRRKGRVAKSQEVVSICVLAAGLITLNAFGPAMIERLAALSRVTFGNALDIPISAEGLQGLARGLFVEMGMILLPVTAVLALTGLAANVAQSGFLISTDSVTPKLERINPIERVKGYFSTRGAVEATKMVLKVAIVTTVAWLAIRADLDRIFSLFWGGLAGSYAEAWRIAYGVGMKVIGALFLLAALDYGYQRWQFERDIRMSREEIKEEHKQQEGDPMVKARVRSIQRDIARRRMMAAVPKADVVITNPTHVAVALRYDAESLGAPTVVAKGMRRVAQRIKEIAREHGVPVVESPALARSVHKAVKVGGVIPVALYRAVAEIIALAYRLKGRAL